ncbi:MAG: branched-chain amino acid transaminase [Bacteroidota bacterium]|nr:branched-chain amino acid transaminase [Bacteroidota bacterium]
MYYNNDTFIYWNGKIIKASEAKIDLYSETMHYGYGVFEGIRSYKIIDGGTKIFKEVEHFERLKNSARALNLPYEWNSEELIAATYEILKLNNIQDAYIRPLVYAPANMSFSVNNESFIVIETWQMQPFLGEKLLNVMTSSFERPNPKAFKIEAKATGHYVNSILASQEAKAKGFDEALLKDMQGYVAEAPGANIFMEKDGALVTPQLGNILPGITRATVFEICNELNIPVIEKQITLAELHEADSAFFCGTAAEIIGIATLDKIPFKKDWNDSLGSIIQKEYKDLVTGKTKKEQLEAAN